jgi:cyclopropane fatty-acyl-phospholipid synthase-like methyltransferase
VDRDLFAHQAGTYEQDGGRVDNVDKIAKTVIKNTSLDKRMHLMDFGSGTGLLLERVAPHVGKITAVDISKSMNEQLNRKRAGLGCDLELLEIDLETDDIADRFDGIISSMTMHHVRDVEAMFRKFHALVKEGGFIAISDLDKEDGSFHTEDTGVYHLGFDREEIAGMATAAGFKEVAVLDASVIHKPQGDFGVFMLKAGR